MVTPVEISFKDALVGLSYETTVTVVNERGGDVMIEIYPRGLDNDWTITSKAIMGVWLAPGEYMEFSVHYTPLEAGETEGEIAIEPWTPNGLVVQVSGRATLPPVAQVIEELDFGALEPGEERTLPVVIRNAGTGVLRVTSASLSGKQFTLEEIEFSEGLGPYEETRAQLEIPITFSPSIPNGGYPDFGTLTLELEGGVRPAIDVNLVGSCTKIIEPPPF